MVVIGVNTQLSGCFNFPDLNNNTQNTILRLEAVWAYTVLQMERNEIFYVEGIIFKFFDWCVLKPFSSIYFRHIIVNIIDEQQNMKPTVGSRLIKLF